MRDTTQTAIQTRERLKGKEGDHPRPRRPCRMREREIQRRGNRHERNLWKKRTFEVVKRRG